MSIGASRERKDSLHVIAVQLSELKTTLTDKGVSESHIKEVIDERYNNGDIRRIKDLFVTTYGSGTAVDQIEETITALEQQHKNKSTVKAAVESVFGEIPTHMYM